MIVRVLMLSLSLLSCIFSASASIVQTSLSLSPQRDNSTAPFVFNSLSGLLKEWPNTYHSNGHAIIPGTLEPFTLLYHARKLPSLPPSPEWFAFDPEMSYGIMAGWGHTYMLTYRNVRPAKIVYFDGMSASLSGEGWLDSQEVIAAGRGQLDEHEQISWYDEYTRARKLCAWAVPRGIEGIVRMNAGFELLWCDFNSPSIQLVSNLNITPPASPPYVPWQSPSNLDDPPEPPRRRPGDGDGRRPPPWDRAPSPLAQTTFTEWLRAANHRADVPQPHIKLDLSSYVSFYHPRLQSLVQPRSGKPMRKHRIWPNVSIADAQSVVRELDDVLFRSGRRAEGSGMDWAALARDIVEEWSDRIDQLHEFLGNATVAVASTGWKQENTTQTLAAVRRLAYSPLNPYMDTGIGANTSAWILFFEPDISVGMGFPRLPRPSIPHVVNTSALQRCTYGATSFLDHTPFVRKTPQEELLQTSIETVLERLCTDFGMTFAESMETEDTTDIEEAQTLFAKWDQRMSELTQWLDWTERMRCQEVCPLDSVCTMPLWPVVRFMGPGPGRGPGRNPPPDEEEDPSNWEPRCVSVNAANRFSGPGRRRIMELDEFEDETEFFRTRGL